MRAPSRSRRAGSSRPAGTPTRLPRAREAIALVVIGVSLVLAVALLQRSRTSNQSVSPDRDGGATASARPTGDALYAGFCETCHGPNGRGDGPAAPLCRVPPADFTRAEFKVRSTATGALPLDRDLRDVIRRGAGGDGAMPAFETLGPENLDQLIARIKAFSPRWRSEPPPDALVPPDRRGADATQGAKVYEVWGCAACHGASGAGDGPSAKDLRTTRGAPDPPQTSGVRGRSRRVPTSRRSCARC